MEVSNMTHDPANFREYAGVLTATLIIAAYILLGFLQLLLPVFTGTTVTLDQAWNASMLGLVGGSLGFLIGKQSTGQPTPPTVNVPVNDGTTTTIQTQ